ncbi:MAG: class I SAM-dependent methyltransferase [Chitinophagaceae bacterium]
MAQIIHYTNCPVCGSTDLVDVLSTTDYTVSGETFMIIECNSCTLRFTQDVPDAVSILPYYKSEDYISHTNTSRGLINRLYKFVRLRTMITKRKLVEKSTGLAKGSLLDIGSGIGTFVNEMKQHGWHTTGLEPEPEARETSKKLYNLDLKATAELNKLPANSFDAITLWHVLEHVHDLHDHMQQLKILLKQNGRLFIAVPNYTSKDAEIYKQFWAAYDVPRHLYHFSPGSIKKLLEKNGLKLVQCKPMWYDSFYISLLSSKNKKGKADMVAAFWNGLSSDIKALSNVEKCSSVIYIISK